MKGLLDIQDSLHNAFQFYKVINVYLKPNLSLYDRDLTFYFLVEDKEVRADLVSKIAEILPGSTSYVSTNARDYMFHGCTIIWRKGTWILQI